MELNDILYIVGIIGSLILGALSVWSMTIKIKNRGMKQFEAKETQLGKILVKNFSGWLISFTLFTSIVLFIFCVSMLAV